MALSHVRAMLITAGFGTRLAPLTDLLPKPAVPIANHPVAWFALDHLARAGITDVVLNTHHLAAALEQSLRAAAPRSQQLRFVHEPAILGTGGGVKNAWQPRAGETFVVMNGKLVFAPDLEAAYALHSARDAFATMIVKEVDASDPTGVVSIDEQGRVRGLPGHAAAESGGLRRCMYTGVSLLSEGVHARLPDDGCLIRQGYAQWLASQERVYAYVEPSSFRDVGMSHWHYLEANLALASGAQRWPGITPERGCLIDASAQLASSAQLEQCVIGASAHVDAGAQLSRCVLWPGARASGTHQSCVFLPDGRALQVPLSPRRASDTAAR